MALTQEQIERMDAIVGIAPTQENNLEQKNINLSDDEFKKMDEITGLKPLEDIQLTQSIQEIDEIEEEIKRKNPDDYANWKSKEPISAYNAAKNAAREFNGTYDNIDENANLNWFENFLKNSEWSKNRSASVDSKIAQEKEKNKQREQRINEGSATLGDKISNAFKNAAQSNIQDAQQKAQINKVAQGVNETDKTSRYEVSGVTKGGQPIYREVDLLEQIGFLEGIQKNLSKNIPIIGALADGADNKKQREIKDKILKGEPIRQDELNYLNYATKRKQEEYIRGYSTAGQIGQGTIDSLGISADILLGSGLASALKIGSVATRAANVSGKLAPVAEWGVNSLAGAGAGLLANPQRIYANYQERMIGNEMKVTDSGMMIFQESEEKPATALIKSMMGTYLMYFTELGGGQILKGIGSGIAKGANAIVNKVDGGRSATVMAKLMEKNPKLKNFLDKTTSELSKRYEQLKGMPVVGKSTGWIKDKAHFDGFLEEMGEEALEDVLNLTFGVNNEERSLENYIDAVFKSPEEWAIIAGTIAITGAGLSATSYFLGEKMAEAGVTQEDIEDVLLNTTENQKKELISEQMQNENIDIVESAKYQIQNRDYNLELDNKQIEVENTVYNKLLKGNVQKDVALANAKLISNAFRNKSTEAQEVFLKNLERLDVEFNIPAEQRENGVYQQAAKDFVGVAGANENEVKDAQREWEEKGTESKYFKKWFGESKVVDEAGKPLVVYHGTQAEPFSVFGENQKGWRTNKKRAFYFSTSKDYSKTFAGINSKGKKTSEHSQIMEVYLSLKNPLVISNDEIEDVGYWLSDEELDNLEKQGYDGFITEDMEQIVVLHPEQIKSVDNRGTFDAENPNIYYQGIKELYNDIKDHFLYLKDIKLKGDSRSVEDLFANTELKSIQGFFGDVIKDVKFRKQPKWMQVSEKDFGGYLYLNNTIYLNYDYIKQFENYEQQFVRTLLHELVHLKQYKMLEYAINNQDNKELSEADRGALKLFIQSNNISKEDEKILKDFSNKYTEKDLENNPELVKTYVDAYNRYNRADLEVDADNVGLALQSYMGGSENRQIKNYTRDFLVNEKLAQATSNDKTLGAIRAFIWRKESNHFGYGRLTDKVNTRTFYQSAKAPVQDEKNLIMTHSAKIENLDDILANDTLIAPSMAITNKNQDVLNDFGFGDLIFIRKPDRIDFKTDNIYDRDIYSPRMPRPSYKTKRHGSVSTYDYDDMKRQAERNPERFEEVYGESFEEYFEGAEKVLFMGYTPSGKRKYVPYNADNIIKMMKKEGVVGGEHWGYGLNSFLAQLAKKQKNLKQLKKSSVELGKVELEVIEKLKKEYSDYENELRSYAKADYKSFTYFNDIYPDVLKAIYNNNSYEINEYLDVEKIKAEAPELINNIKEFINTAAKTNRTYFEAKPMREVVLDEFSDVLVRENSITDEQKRKLERYGIRVTEYKNNSEISDTIKNIGEKHPNIYFQESDQNNLIAGYTPLEVMTKSQELYDKLGDIENPVSESEAAKILANAHILQDAIDANGNKDNYTPEQLEDLFLNAYYVMNDQELPDLYMEDTEVRRKTGAEYREIHNRKKEQQEEAYRGYFMEGQDKDLITIMSNQDASTALHELAHWYLNALNEMAKVDEASRKQLDKVDKWLGRSGDYTVSQQEKFARSFEAYLYKGKAPNSYLKEVFENFKQWLKSVYAHITEIEGLGADISKEVEEMFDRMFSNDEYYQERKQANELLKKAKKDSRKQKAKNNTIRADRELDEVEKRHKEVSYQILSAATGKSVKYLKTIFETTSENATHAKKREAIINSLDSVEDSIKISGGMREEWKEFYSDTGVDYETSESGADYELALKALDTILNKSYKNISKDYESEMSDRAEYFENLIKDAEREYKILLNSYKKENRNVALAAIYDWMDSLDSTIKEDFEQKFIYDSRIIERNEHLDKFEKAKRKIIAKALEVENRYGINKDEKYKEVVVEIMKNLNFLQAEDKARLTTNILDIIGVDLLMGRIDSIMDIAKTMEDVNYRRMLQREIHKELQGTKNIKKGPRTVGKYDYRTNKLFEELRELDKLTPEKANEIRLDMRKLVSAEDNGLGYREKLAMKFLSYKANGMIYADTDLMKEIYDEIVRIKLAGKTAKNEVDLQEKLDESKEIERLVEIVKSKNKDKKKGKANIILRGYIDGFGNLESTLNGIFNKKVADEYGAEILYAETQADVMQYEIKDKFENEVAKIYDLPKWDWDRQIIKYLGEKYTFQENRRKYDPETFELTKSLTVEKEMTKMDLILAYMWSRNQTLEKRLINMFGEQQLDSMIEELSPQDIKFAELMLRTAQSTYPQANKAYIKKYGLDLPKVTAYFPSKVERGTEIDLFNDYSSKSLNNAFTKSRTTSELVPMEFSNPVQILYNHIDGVAKFVNMVEHLDKANVILNNKEFLKPVIIEKFGDDVYKTLTQILLNTTYKAESKVYNGIQKIFDYLSSNWIVANISTRPIVALKQLLSANNYASEMPVVEWSKGFVKSVFDYKNTIDYMMKIPYVKARLGGSMQNEFLKQYVNNSAFARTKKIKDFLAMNVKLGDAGSLIFGGKPYIDYLISQGVSESEAIKQFVLQTNRTQQSSAISSMSNFQVSASRQPLARVATAYRNAQAQYLRKCADAIIAYTNGDIELKQCAKTVYHYMFLQPFLFNVATSGSLLIWATSGDDEEFWADFKLSMLNLCMDSVGMLAELYNFVIRQIVEGEKYRPVNTPLWGDIQREITRIAKEDAEFEDFVNGFGYLFGNIGTGVPVPAIANMGEGAVQMVSDDFLTGFFRLLGYSETRANKMSGN